MWWLLIKYIKAKSNIVAAHEAQEKSGRNFADREHLEKEKVVSEQLQSYIDLNAISE